MKITKTSILTGNLNSMEIDITQEELDRINARRNSLELIQNIVPQMPMVEREFLISGITPEESIWAFGESD